MKTSLPNRVQRWWKVWLTSLLRSITDLDSYGDILNTRLRRSILIVAAFYVCVGAVVALTLSLTTFKDWQGDLLTLQTHVVNNFPYNLEYRWDGTTLQATPPSSLAIDFPETMNWDLQDTLITIDPAQTTPPEETRSLLFVTADRFAVSIDGSWNDAPLSELLGPQPLTINKTILEEKVAEWQNGIRGFFLILPILGFPFIVLGLLLSKLLMLVLDTIIVHFVFTLMKKPIPYQKVFQLLLHVLIPAELITQATLLLYPKTDVPMFTIAFWLFTTILIWHLRNLHVVRFEPVEKKGSEQ